MAGAVVWASRSTARRGDVLIDDGTFAGPDGQPVEAFLVRPMTTSARAAGLVAWHWFDPKATDGDRTQFRDEAVELAGRGVVSDGVDHAMRSTEACRDGMAFLARSLDLGR